jgi:hypothetical protein
MAQYPIAYTRYYFSACVCSHPGGVPSLDDKLLSYTVPVVAVFTILQLAAKLA